jgi:hypothetical protein
MATPARKRKTNPWLNLLTFALWALATIWVGWRGAVIFFVALVVGGVGTVYNGVTRGDWQVR